MALKKLTDQRREEIIFELRKKFKTMRSYMDTIDSLTKALAINKEEDLYDWKKDKSLRVNQPGYDPKKN